MCADEGAERLDEAGEVGPQRLEPGQFLQGLLVHVERAIDLDLQAVPVLGGAALAAGGLAAPVALGDPHLVTKPAQEAGDENGEIGPPGRAVPGAPPRNPVP